MKTLVSFPGCHRRGGVERVMLETVNHLAQQGHDVHAFAADCERERLHIGVRLHQIHTRPPFRFLTVPTFIRATRRAIAASRVSPDVSLGFGAASQPGDVVWMTSVHAEWLRISKDLRSGRDRLLQRLNPFHPVILHLERRMLRGRRYRHVIALTERVKSEVVQHYQVPSGDISVIPNGYAEGEFNLQVRQQHRTEMRQSLGIPLDAKVLIFVANEAERKGFPQLLRAMARLSDPNVHLLAVGRLSSSKYAPLIAQLELAKRVHFTGPSQEVNKYYAASDAFVLPTLYEAWGLVIVEAMACGLPVVTSRLAGASVSVQEGRNGWLLDDPSDHEAITSHLSTLLRGEHASLEDIADSVKPYRWSQVLSRLEGLLQECVPRSSPAMTGRSQAYESSFAH